MPKAKKIRASLTPDQLAFYKQKIISDTRKVKEWVSFFKNLTLLDKLDDLNHTIFKWITITGIVGIIGSIIFMVVQKENWIIALIGLSIAITGFGFWRIRKLDEEDLNNYLRLFFFPILQVLMDKAGGNARLAATLDFRDSRDTSPRRSTVMGGREQKLYSPTYILARTQLLDGVKLNFAMQDEIKDQNWTKTNYRGKVKYKSKTKTTHHLLIRMSFPADKYTWNGDTTEDLVIEQNGEQFEAKKKVKIKQLGDEVLSVKHFFDAIQSVYAKFTPQGEQPVREREGDSEEIYDDGDAVVAAYVWHGAYFNRYDYDSMDYQDSSDMSYEDDEGTVFDS
ncbi:MAG: hypothetical protein R8G66_14400 [Cytophagales bacterium]|nr:hypothetical protein [Cytophagales bacterium]